MTTIKSVKTSDRESVIALIVLAFSADPAARWTYPNPDDYLRHFPKLVRTLGEKAFEHNAGYYVDGFSGAALWLPPGVQPQEEEMLANFRQTVPERRQEELFSVFEQMGSYHPAEPHWYLPFIGVDPAQQGNGYGSALMKHALISCDREMRLAYLESSNSRNIPLYQRHEFELLGTIQVGSSPPIFPMLRKPQAAVQL